MKLYRPVSQPINTQNLFGANPTEYAKFGLNGHEGLDFEAPSGTPLYAPCDGDAFYVSDKYGGDGLWMRVPDNIKPEYNVILWHLYPKGNLQFPFKIPTDGSVASVKTGQLLAYTDNSGAPNESTGPHLHLGVMPCDPTGAALAPANGFHGCVDPMPFLSGILAENYEEIQSTVQAAAAVSQEVAESNLPTQDKLSLFSKVVAFLKYLLNL